MSRSLNRGTWMTKSPTGEGDSARTEAIRGSWRSGDTLHACAKSLFPKLMLFILFDRLRRSDFFFY